LAVIASGSVGRAPPTPSRAAVIELIHQPGRSFLSAPPISFAGEFTRDPSIIVMSLRIDYWDYLGWKDTARRFLATPIASAPILRGAWVTRVYKPTPKNTAGRRERQRAWLLAATKTRS